MSADEKATAIEKRAQNLKALAPDGRLVFIAVQGGPKVKELNVLPIWLDKNCRNKSTSELPVAIRRILLLSA